jgi:hypothetical protein
MWLSKIISDLRLSSRSLTSSNAVMRIQRPGSGLPLEDMPTWEDGAEDNRRFPHAIADFFSTQGVTLREQRMLEFISQVTDKPSWWEKINNPEIVARWREEACGTEEQQRTSSDHLDHNSFDYVRTHPSGPFSMIRRSH